MCSFISTIDLVNSGTIPHTYMCSCISTMVPYHTTPYDRYNIDSTTPCSMANATPDLTDDAERLLLWIRVIFSGMLTLAVTVLVFGRRWILVRLAALRLASKRLKGVTVRDGEYVKRPEKEKEVLVALKSPNYETVLVYGSRGSGKTSLIGHTLKGRKGVFEIKISEKSTGSDASVEIIELLSKEIDILQKHQDRGFVQDVFAASWVPPIVVVSLEPRCNGEVLESVLTMCKIVSYEQIEKQTARFVVVLSGSRAAIDSSMRLKDLRCVGVHVGNFSRAEALMYTTERVPTTFVDVNRRNQIAERVVDVFDWRVLTLQEVCNALRKGAPGDMKDVDEIIKKEWESAVMTAARGWREFCRKLAEALGDDYSVIAVDKVVTMLKEKPQHINDIADALLANSKSVPISPRDIGLFNADAGAHPLAIDAFETTAFLSGKAITAALSKKPR